MIYQMYQAQADIMDPFRLFARNSSILLRSITPGQPYGIALRHITAALDVLAIAAPLINDLTTRLTM
jgi:poly(3-hydroxybutyrate) depolymerase